MGTPTSHLLLVVELVLKALKAFKVLLEHRELLVLKAFKALLVLKAFKVLLEHRELLVLKVSKERLDHQLQLMLPTIHQQQHYILLWLQAQE
jgi:hypothetical protein